MASIYSDEQLLDIDYRKKILKEIQSKENLDRKKESMRRYDLMKDRNKKYVMERLRKEMDSDTCDEMEHRASNISIFRAVVDKKAQIYANGVEREYKTNQEALDIIIDELNLDTQMKKINRTLEAQKNAIAQIVPYEDENGMYSIKFNVLQPHNLDVINDCENPEMPRAVIFSYYDDNSTANYQMQGAMGGLHSVSPKENSNSDGMNNVIADVNDDKNEYMVWWSKEFHFTTNSKGEIISGAELENPIKELPFVFFHLDQDGKFWAEGGEDLADGSITVNQLLTDLHFIAKVQSMGLFYLFAKNVPKSVKVGPSKAIIVEVKDGEPTPQIGFASSNPPITEYLGLIRSHLSNILKANDLNPGDVIGDLTTDGASSGVQEIIQKAEIQKSIKNKIQMFTDKEKEIFEIIFKWIKYLYEINLLYPELYQYGIIEDEKDLVVKFPKPEVFKTEKDQLEIIEKRRALGLDSIIDSIILDNPQYTIEQATERATRVIKEKLIEKNLILQGMIDGNRPSDIQSKPESGVIEDIGQGQEKSY